MTYTILVVEDEIDVCENIEELLRNNSYNVITAYSGIEAIRSFTKQTPHLIVSDISMPGLNGLDLLEYVRSNKKLCCVPFIFLTSKTTYEEMRTGMIKGADDYLLKPYHASELLKAIELRLNKRDKLLEHMEEIKNNIIMSVTHELRTPLVPIFGFSRMLVDYSDKLTSGEIVEIGSIIKKSAIQLKSTIDKFLLYSSLQYELNEFEKIDIHFPADQQIIKAMIETVIASELKNERDKITRNYPGDLNYKRINIDEKYLSICIKELLENAVKFSTPYSQIYITGKMNEDDYELEFRNKGDIKYEEDITSFNIFNKRNNLTVRGSGLGLPIVKKIAEYFGGRVTLRVEQDNIISVSLTLPVRQGT